MKISVVCPIYNEEKYIEKLIQFFLQSKINDKELILVDGGSTDKTLNIIDSYTTKYPGQIILLPNKFKYAPHAMNIGIRAATGDYIARVDAHTLYPNDYLGKCLEISLETNATNVGGYIHSKGEGTMGNAIAYAMSCKFGVGDSDFRTVIKDGYVDTVPFGFWKKSAFDTYGYFDEQLIRNQDDELNARFKSKGATIFQSSKITSEYYVRNSITKMASQYFQYGLFKPLVLKKVNAALRLRHLIPAFFTLYIAGIWLSIWCPIYLLPLLFYIALDFYFSFRNKLQLASKWSAFIVFPMLHFSYGSGFILGILKK